MPVSVDYATADRPASIYGTNGNAYAWSDYAPTNGTLIFNPGETNKTISVTIFDNGEPDEPSEAFFVNLTNYTNVALVIPQAIGTILDRGAPCTLKLTAIGVVGSDVRLSFATETNKTYRLEWTDALAVGPWTTVPGAENISGTGGIVNVTNVGAGNQSRRFYRVTRGP